LNCLSLYIKSKWLIADGEEEPPSSVKREVYLAIQETRSSANDERGEPSDAPASRFAPRGAMSDYKT
jgi:hypothetical protein